MSDIICVTNRKLCEEDFLDRLRRIAECRPAGIMLREKDLSEEEYETLAARVMEICDENSTTCILHSFAGTAARLSAKALHMPMNKLKAMTVEEKACFELIGASCHSAEEVACAQELGCGYVTAGHVFQTDCKRGLEPRGLDFLREACRAADIPVYAIGGVNAENIGSVIAAGAAGVCVMSGLMTCDDPKEYMRMLRAAGCA